MKNLFMEYMSWREETEELIKDGHEAAVNCGEASVREDFSNYADIEEISFDDMLKLEQGYEKHVHIIDKYNNAIEIAGEAGKLPMRCVDEVEELVEVLEMAGFDCYVDPTGDYLITEK